MAEPPTCTHHLLSPVRPQDTAEHVEQAFSQHWSQQLQGTARLRHRQGPSLTFAFAGAFGGPFLASGGLKLVHDLCIFVGPFLLKRIILFLDDPSLPLWLGLRSAPPPPRCGPIPLSGAPALEVPKAWGEGGGNFVWGLFCAAIFFLKWAMKTLWRG